MPVHQIPMQVRNERGRVFTYLVDARAQVNDVVTIPTPYWLGNGSETGIVVARESDYEGYLVSARWNASLNASLRVGTRD